MSKELTPLEALKSFLGTRGWYDDEFQQRYDLVEKSLKALEIVKVLFKDRAKLYERNAGIQQVIDKNGNYKKAPISVYILEFYVGDLHYEFHLQKEEFDLLKEVLS